MQKEKKISSWIDDEIMKEKMGVNGFSRCITICNSVNSIPEVKEKTILINMINFWKDFASFAIKTNFFIGAHEEVNSDSFTFQVYQIQQGTM